MNATEDIGWLDDAAVLDATVERLKIVKGLGLNAGLDFHGRLHRPMAKQLAKALEPYRPLFIEVSQDGICIVMILTHFRSRFCKNIRESVLGRY